MTPDARGLLPWPALSDAILERQETENTKGFPSLLRIRHTGIGRKSGEMARNRMQTKPVQPIEIPRW